ncbi:MAG: amidohydrolase family protein, partial [Planctomycetota bacterium]
MSHKLSPNSTAIDGPIGLIRGGAVAGFDEFAPATRPGAVAVAEGRVIDAGPTIDLERRYLADAAVVRDRPGELILPGMVNAHAHLQLTTIGPQPYTGDFVSWVEMLRRHWPGDGEPFAKQPSESWFVAAVRDGAKQSLAAGVQAVGDIIRFDAEARARRETGLDGIGFVELFGHGPPFDHDARARLTQPAEGFQPHAPYSAGPAVFESAAASGRPVSTHLAETRDELEFVATGRGAFLDLLKAPPIKWDDTFADHYAAGLSPVRWMEPYLRRTPWLLAHCNYVDDDDIALLAETGSSVVYCPIASEYFGHHHHRYRDMLEAGMNVCLGTDSIVCQPSADVEPQPLG